MDGMPWYGMVCMYTNPQNVTHTFSGLAKVYFKRQDSYLHGCWFYFPSCCSRSVHLRMPSCIFKREVPRTVSAGLTRL